MFLSRASSAVDDVVEGEMWRTGSGGGGARRP